MIIKTNSYFDGEKILHGKFWIEIQGEKIITIYKRPPSTSNSWIDFTGSLITPGWIDVHINGGGGYLFNDVMDPQDLTKILKSHARFGTTAIMPTLISDRSSKMQKQMQLIDCVIKDNLVPGILGIHLEGPFIDKAHRGTHQNRYIQSPDSSNISQLIGWGDKMIGKKILTLAPEKFTLKQLKSLKDAGFIIMVGHTGITFEDLEKRMIYLDGFTHFYNGMGKISARRPQSIGYVLAQNHLNKLLTVIIDQDHVHPIMLKMLLNRERLENIIMITDSMATLGTRLKEFKLQGKKIQVKKNTCLDEKGILSGTNLSLIDSVNYLLRIKEQYNLPFNLPEVIKFLSFNPAKLLNYEYCLGKIKPGYRADLTVIDILTNNQLKVRATLTQGQFLYQRKSNKYITNNQ